MFSHEDIISMKKIIVDSSNKKSAEDRKSLFSEDEIMNFQSQGDSSNMMMHGRMVDCQTHGSAIGDLRGVELSSTSTSDVQLEKVDAGFGEVKKKRIRRGSRGSIGSEYVDPTFYLSRQKFQRESQTSSVLENDIKGKQIEVSGKTYSVKESQQPGLLRRVINRERPNHRDSECKPCSPDGNSEDERHHEVAQSSNIFQQFTIDWGNPRSDLARSRQDYAM